MDPAPLALYIDLMATLRARLDTIASLGAAEGNDFSRAETAAFHGRKVIEGIAFACLVAVQNGLKRVPRDAKGQWNAESIFKNLQSKNISTLPSPSILRAATESERKSANVKIVIEGVSERRITHAEIVAMYRRLHYWLHELNPYTSQGHAGFYSTNGRELWTDLAKLDGFIERHVISISGEAYFCVLRDSKDGRTKVLPLSKVAELPPELTTSPTQ
jgi:hypothetical protein